MKILLFVSLLLVFASPVYSQKTPAPEIQLLTRTSTRRETARFSYGGTVTLIAAPRGSVTVEGWSRNEVEVTANIELKAPTEADLDQLVKVNTFVFDEDLNHISILTTGTHDRAFMKRSAKNFPKKLLNLPWKIDFRVRVPINTDLEVNAGHGEVKLSGVEGALRLSATESDTMLTLTGGTVSGTVTAGSITFAIPARSWRGAGADIRIASGIINVDLQPGFSGDIDADVLRTGKIVNTYDGLASREKPGLTERTVRARAGAGGAYFKFTVGDGTVNIRRASQ
ncbi:MAG TPA: hypothetical protein VGP83_00865 [Pyrinomonadaceae bacterium]|jgi:hypothetical protein|nr:hypothetical protein [Pyrinomonadaceae bacterium]